MNHRFDELAKGLAQSLGKMINEPTPPNAENHQGPMSSVALHKQTTNRKENYEQ